ncbi:MAG: hypothetical protein LW823_04135 [Rickettsiales bacterium]|nr:hypothetical protein [Rickettsiales bacterium]
MVESRELYNNPKGLPRLEPSAHDPIAVPTSLPDSPGALAAMIENYTAMLARTNNPTVKALIQALISKAEIKKSEIEAEETFKTVTRLAAATGASATVSAYGLGNDNAFTRAAFQYLNFSPDELRYFDSFNPTESYTLLAVGKDGNLTGEKLPSVSGAQLREDFARLKFHTLSPQQQAQVRDQIPTEPSPASSSPDASKPQAEPPKPGTLGADKREMEQLQQSMDRLEGVEAQRSVERHKGANDAARGEIRQRHQHFERAREISGEIIERVERVETREAQVKGLEAMAQVPMPMMPNIAAMVLPVAKENLEQEKRNAASDIKEKREELRQTIQEDVIDKGLVGNPQQPSQSRGEAKQPPIQISGATDVKADDLVTPGNAISANQKSNTPAIT